MSIKMFYVLSNFSFTIKTTVYENNCVKMINIIQFYNFYNLKKI